MIRREQVGDWAVALGLWSCLGFGAGYYYAFTAPGALGWPLPTPEGVGAAWLFQSIQNTVHNDSAWLQRALWVLAFPAAGTVWTLLLWLIAPRFDIKLPPFTDTLRDLAWGAAPVTLLSLGMTLWAWWKGWGFWWSYMGASGWTVRPQAWHWVASVFLGAAIVSSSIQMIVLWLWSPRDVRSYLGFVATGLLLAVCVCAGMGLAVCWGVNIAHALFKGVLG